MQILTVVNLTVSEISFQDPSGLSPLSFVVRGGETLVLHDITHPQVEALRPILDAAQTSGLISWSVVVLDDQGIVELVGDVSAGPGNGTQTATVVGLQGNTLSSASPALNDVLTWDGSQWAPTVPASGGGITTLTGDVTAGPGVGSQAATVVKLQGRTVDSAAPSVNDVLAWDGTKWAPAPAPSATSAFRYTATGGESDFMVTLPVAKATDTYKVVASCAGVATIVGIDLPDVLAADRTTTQFRVITSLPLTAGDQIDFIVCG